MFQYFFYLENYSTIVTMKLSLYLFFVSLGWVLPSTVTSFAAWRPHATRSTLWAQAKGETLGIAVHHGNTRQPFRRHNSRIILTTSASSINNTGGKEDDDSTNRQQLAKKKKRLTREFLLIGGPALIQLAAEPLAALVDTAYLGRLGPNVLGGAGVAISAQYAVSKLYNDPLLRTSISLVAAQDGKARSSLVAEENQETAAANQQKDLSIAVSSALLLAATVGIVQLFVYSIFCQGITRSMGLTQTSTMWHSAVSYLRVRAFGTPAATLWLVANGVFRGLVGSVFVKRLDLPSVRLQAWAAVASIAVLLPLTLFMEAGQFDAFAQAPWQIAACLFFAGIIVSVGAHTAYYRLLQEHDANLIVPLTLFTPILTILFGAWLTGDAIGGRLIAGGAIALAGVAIIVLRPSATFTRRFLVRPRF